MTSYKPHRVIDAAILAGDSTYPLPTGVVVPYDLGSGDITVKFPESPEANDTVTLKNARGEYLGIGDVNKLTVQASGDEIELPGAFDTDTFVSGTGSFVMSHPRGAVRWIYTPADTVYPTTGVWVIDTTYDPGGYATKITGDYTIHPGQIALCDTTGGPLKLTIPAGLPDHSWFVATKTSHDISPVVLESEGAETFQPLRVFSNTFAALSTLVRQGDTATYVKIGTAWHLVNKDLATYVEIYYLPGVPYDIVTPAQLLNIALFPGWPESLLFQSNVDGLLTLTSTITETVNLQVTTQILFENTIAANNQDVWAQVRPERSGAANSSILLPINSAFAHARSGTFGDTKTASSLVQMTGGDTLGFYAEEIDSSGGSTSDITGMIVAITL